LAQAGRIEEAKHLLGRLLQEAPRFGLAQALKTFSFASDARKAVFVGALMVAGLPDNRAAR
jgi:hypothetical protein